MLHYLKYPIPKFHKELIQLTKYPRVALAAPRKFAKSTYMSVFYPLFFGLEKPGSSITLISASHAMAVDWISKIRKELDTSSTLRDFYGEQSPKMADKVGKWSEDELHLANGTVFRGKGAGQQIRGGENHLIVCDDLETDETVVSKAQTEKLTDWFKADVLGSTMPWSQALIVGTILHPDSLLNNLILEPLDEDWITRKYQALQEDGSSLFEDLWSADYLRKRRNEIGEYLFEQEYQNNPIPSNLRKFREEHIQYFEQEPEGCVYFVVGDAGNKLGAKNDPTALVTVAVDNDHNWYVVDVVNKRMLPSETINKIFDLYDRYTFASAGIESVVFDTVYAREMTYQRTVRNKYPIFVELKHSGRKKEMRIEALQPRFEAKKVYIKKEHTELKSQLLRFPSLSGHDDVIDALAYLMDIYRPANKNERQRLNPLSFNAHLDRLHSIDDGNSNGPRYWGNETLFKE